MYNRRTVTIAAGMVLVAAAPPAARAQWDAHVMLGTRLGAGSSQDGTANVPGSGVQAIILRQSLNRPWIVGGIRVGYALRSRLALEFGYTAASVQVAIDASGDTAVPFLAGTTNGAVHTFVLRPRAQVGPLGVAAVGHFFAGPALTWRTGGRFNDFSGTVRAGWNVGLGAALDVDKLSLRFRADLEDVIYPLALRQPGVFETDRMVWHDILLTVGVALLRP